MDRAEATGLGIAVVGHAALVVALSMALAARPEEAPPPPPPMEVSFEEDVGPVSSATSREAAAAPAQGNEQAPPEPAPGADAAIPEYSPPTLPQPTPLPQPSQSIARDRPEQPRRDARANVPSMTRPVATAPSNPPPRPPVSRPQTQRPRPGQPGPGQAPLARGGRLPSAGSFGSDPAGAPARSALSGGERQQLLRNISSLIQPCAARQNPPNGFARSISVDLRVTVNRDGTYASHRQVSASGTNDSNEDYVDDVEDVAIRAVRACAGRIGTLPADTYALSNGWRTFTYRFRFP